MNETSAPSSTIRGRGDTYAVALLVRDPRAAAVAVLASAVFLLVVAVPTDLIDTPWFMREIPPTWWAWPSLVVSSVLGGLVSATYVQPTRTSCEPGDSVVEPGDRVSSRGGYVAGLLTFVAVGCPVCNKLVLLSLGAAGAVTWFQPFQPLLQVAAIALLTWALVRRLRNRASCPAPSARAPTP